MIQRCFDFLARSRLGNYFATVWHCPDSHSSTGSVSISRSNHVDCDAKINTQEWDHSQTPNESSDAGEAYGFSPLPVARKHCFYRIPIVLGHFDATIRHTLAPDWLIPVEKFVVLLQLMNSTDSSAREAIDSLSIGPIVLH